MAALFSSSMAEAVSRSVNITDTTPATLERFLRFAYGGTFLEEWQTDIDGLKALLALADKYDVKALQERAENALMECTDATNALDHLAFADAQGQCAARLRRFALLVAENNEASLKSLQKAFRRRRSEKQEVGAGEPSSASGTKRKRSSSASSERLLAASYEHAHQYFRDYGYT